MTQLWKNDHSTSTNIYAMHKHCNGNSKFWRIVWLARKNNLTENNIYVYILSIVTDYLRQCQVSRGFSNFQDNTNHRLWRFKFLVVYLTRKDQVLSCGAHLAMITVHLLGTY